MSRLFGRHVAPEMVALLAVELGLSFCLSYLVLSPADGVVAGGAASAANRAAVVALSVGLVSFMLGLYRPGLFLKTRTLFLSTVLGGVLAFPVAYLAMAALDMHPAWVSGRDMTWPLKMLVLWIGGLFAVRLSFLVAVRLKLFVRRIALLDARSAVAGAVKAVRADHAGFFEVVPNSGAPEALAAARVRIGLMSREALARLPAEEQEAYEAAGVELQTESEFWERNLKRVDIDHLTPEWFAALDQRKLGWVQATINRGGDIAISLLLLMFTLPLMLLVAVLVRLDSPGPALYRQERVGLGGKPFTLLKFRSMNTNAELRGPAWAQQRDPRVTRIGSFMRRTRIDELPQLINVLRGQMSFIGPRPERPHFVEQLAEAIPYYRERARVKPGLTGWAQVNYPYGASVEDARAKLSYDLYYVRYRSVVLDLSILFATVRVILFQEGAR